MQADMFLGGDAVSKTVCEGFDPLSACQMPL